MKPKTNRAGNAYVPQGMDLCQTPAYAVEPLVPYLKQFSTIWEPAIGEGLLFEALKSLHGGLVVGGDLLTGQNFFDFPPDLVGACLVTNPPYSIKFEWLMHCYELDMPFALLVPVEMIGAQSAQRFMSRYGCEIMLLDRRVNFKMPNKGWEGSAAQFPVLWLCWHVLPAPIIFGHIDTRNLNERTLPLWERASDD